MWFIRKIRNFNVVDYNNTPTGVYTYILTYILMCTFWITNWIKNESNFALLNTKRISNEYVQGVA